MGILSRKHRKNRGARYDRRKRTVARYHVMVHGHQAAIDKLTEWLMGYEHAREHGLPCPPRPARAYGARDPRWAMTPDERARLKAYNTANASDWPAIAEVPRIA